jgi:hypothetical protein
MNARSVKAAKAVAPKAVALVPANPAKDATSLNRVDVIARLANANAKERVLLLSALPMGDVAAIGGKIAGIGASVNEVLHIKLCDKHGNDWAAVAKALPSELCDADKERRKAINQSLESIRETVKANAAGDAQKASETIRRVKEWGLGIRKSKSTPNANKKAPLDTWALSWDVFPAAYRRIMRDDMEDMTPAKSEALLGVADAMAAYFKVCEISAKSVLECSGKTAWNK